MTEHVAARRGEALDPLTAASVSIAWLIVFNKPFYPLYLWYFVGSDAVAPSLTTLIALPLFAAIPFLARRDPLAARLATPLVGAIDTLTSSKVFGLPAGLARFLFPCLLLCAVSFRSQEVWSTRLTVAAVFAAALLAWNGLGGPFVSLPPAETAKLLSLNVYSVASLCAFIALRFAGSHKD